MMTGGEYRVDLRFSKVLIFRAKNSRLLRRTRLLYTRGYVRPYWLILISHHFSGYCNTKPDSNC